MKSIRKALSWAAGVVYDFANIVSAFVDVVIVIVLIVGAVIAWRLA